MKYKKYFLSTNLISKHQWNLSAKYIINNIWTRERQKVLTPMLKHMLLRPFAFPSFIYEKHKLKIPQVVIDY